MATDKAGVEALVEAAVSVAARADGLEAIHAALGRFWCALESKFESKSAHAPDAEWRQLFATAVAEIAANIVRHAHPPGAPSGDMRFTLAAYEDRVAGIFTDHGLAYSPPSTPTTRNPIPSRSTLLDTIKLSEGGFGITLTRACLDELSYERTADGVNRWLLIKRF